MITGRFINWTKRKLEKALSDKEVGRHNFPILVIKDTRIRLFKTQSSILMIISLIYEMFTAALHVRDNPAYGSGAGVEVKNALLLADVSDSVSSGGFQGVSSASCSTISSLWPPAILVAHILL